MDLAAEGGGGGGGNFVCAYIWKDCKFTGYFRVRYLTNICKNGILDYVLAG